MLKPDILQMRLDAYEKDLAKDHTFTADFRKKSNDDSFDKLITDSGLW